MHFRSVVSLAVTGNSLDADASPVARGASLDGKLSIYGGDCLLAVTLGIEVKRRQ